jgi:hypothetical protein
VNRWAPYIFKSVLQDRGHLQLAVLAFALSAGHAAAALIFVLIPVEVVVVALLIRETLVRPNGNVGMRPSGATIP